MSGNIALNNLIIITLLIIFFASSLIYIFPLLQISFAVQFGMSIKPKKQFFLLSLGAVLMNTSALAFIILGLFKDFALPLFIWPIVLFFGVVSGLVLALIAFGYYLVMLRSRQYLDNVKQQEENE